MRVHYQSWLLFFVLAWSGGVELASAQSARPNIVIIWTDDQGYADLSIHGNQDFQTPYIDSIAKNGVRCTSGYVTQPQCSPSRAGMITGRHQSRFGHEENPPNDANPKLGLPLTETTLAERLKRAGYVTGHVGKWHLGHHTTQSPLSRGFDESMCVEGCFDSVEKQREFAESVRTRFTTRGKYAVLWRNGVPEQMPGYVGDVVANEAAAFVERNHDKPFFLYWPHDFPHVPQVTDDKYMRRVVHIADEARRRYAAMMLAVDDGVGKVLATLRKHGIEDNTLIFFMSDNGGPADGRLPCFNTPFTGNKGGMKEGGIRVPYFVQWKAALPAGKVYDPPISTLDIAPTVLAAAGVSRRDNAQFDGVDLTPFFTGKKSGAPHERLYWRYLRRDIWAIREGDWKLFKARGKNEQPQLYDLSTDLAEERDVAAKYPERVRSLKAAYDQWAKGLPQPLWMNSRAEESNE